ncbi:MAG: magnesium/cobalt transporter CorA [Gammaproteobacteria bacterium]|nr:magnesium/cobalt transporter CorA [Gammaproteobacteria bacterium]
MEYFKKMYHPPGTAPGTLTQTREVSAEALSIRLIDYSAIDFLEKDLATIEECKAYLDNVSNTWIHLQGPADVNTIKNVGDIFGLHSLALEDIINTGQRPKVEEYDEQLFVILSTPYLHNRKAHVEQVSIFIGKNYIISFCDGDVDPFEPLRQLLRKHNARIRQQPADYLFYCIFDLVVDQGYPVLKSFGEDIETIEGDILSFTPDKTMLTQSHEIRRELILLRRSLWPQRELINNLLHSELGLISDNTRVYLRDCYDHSTQIIELIENYREMATSLIELYLSSANHRLGDIMKVLTIIATIFIPLTFVVGVYGMNFNHSSSPWAMPELRWYYGYPISWGIMIVIVIAMVIYFKRKNWF